MLIGQTVFVPAAGAPGVKYYGPWMPRQGNAFSGVLVAIKASAASGWTLKADFETKNNEDADSAATTLSGSVTLTATGTGSVSITGCKELVRCLFSCTGGGTDRWIHFRMNPPIWQPN